MQEKSRAEEKIQLEIQQAINRRLYEKGVIDKVTYERAMNELLKSTQALETIQKG